MGLHFFTHPLSRIRHRKDNFIRLYFITQHDRTFIRVLDRIVYEVGKQLVQAHRVEIKSTRRQIRLAAKHNPLMKFDTQLLHQIIQKFFELNTTWFELNCICFYLSQIQHIRDQLQQKFIILLNNLYKLRLFLFIIRIDQ